jgi:hypothetical protein
MVATDKPCGNFDDDPWSVVHIAEGPRRGKFFIRSPLTHTPILLSLFLDKQSYIHPRKEERAGRTNQLIILLECSARYNKDLLALASAKHIQSKPGGDEHIYSLHILHVHLEVTTFYTNYSNGEFLIYSERISTHKHTDSCVLNGGESKKKKKKGACYKSSTNRVWIENTTNSKSLSGSN